MQGMVNSEIRIIKKPTGSSFPAAKNLSKLEGDQVGHRLYIEPDSSGPLLRCITDQDERGALGVEMQKITEMKKAHTGATSIGGSSLHGLSWNISINLGWMCFTHTYYNKVEKEKLVACSIGNNQKIICTFISCSKILNCWLSVLFATNAVDLSSRLLV